ncbi:CocE/NonD family hydrolase [Streptomyces sp. NPDC047108]|uniref:CocE/NonD family hydrolase n=1 Tax=Streptomyces sp. NPDC047108 TaxID=3155025 RepID=UPI0033F645E5
MRLRSSFIAGVILAGAALPACSAGNDESSDSPSASKATDGKASSSASQAAKRPTTKRTAAFQSLYVPMRDGTRIAVDVWLPQPRAARGKVPTAMRATRYWKARAGEKGTPETERWTKAGYALVLVDARGSGASFGTRSSELSKAEVTDYGEILDWIADQPWSTGRVGTFGDSYDGDTAEMMARLDNPHLAAIAPRFNDYEMYHDLIRPGGTEMAVIYRWLTASRALDGVNGAVCDLAKRLEKPCDDKWRAEFGKPRPVDGPDGSALAKAARREHQSNVDIAPLMKRNAFRDDRKGGTSLIDGSTGSYQREISRSGVPMFVPAGWLDAGTANGALSRFLRFDNPQEVMIGPWTHGGEGDANPFNSPKKAAAPSPAQQWRALMSFFDRHVKGSGDAEAKKRIRYYTLGEDRWRTTSVWPPAGTRTSSWELGDGAKDVYEVDPKASTGPASRWNGNLTSDDIVYPDRRKADRRLQTYTGKPLSRDVRVTGMPVVKLRMAVDKPDADVRVYLEDVAPDGRVTYITEGQLRLANRRVDQGKRRDDAVRVPHSYAREDARPMKPGEMEDVTIGLVSTSALFREGHRVRIAVAGADAGNFVPLKDGATKFTIDPGRSTVSLPVAR